MLVAHESISCFLNMDEQPLGNRHSILGSLLFLSLLHVRPKDRMIGEVKAGSSKDRMLITREVRSFGRGPACTKCRDQPSPGSSIRRILSLIASGGDFTATGSWSLRRTLIPWYGGLLIHKLKETPPSSKVGYQSLDNGFFILISTIANLPTFDISSSIPLPDFLNLWILCGLLFNGENPKGKKEIWESREMS